MSKTGKTVAFPSATRLPDTADDWVSGSTDAQKSVNTERQKSATEKPARLTIDLPQELHGRFKAACAKHRTAMKDEVLRFIEDWTQKNG